MGNRTCDRAIGRAIERALEQVSEQSNKRAIARASDRVTERASDSASERSSAGSHDHTIECAIGLFTTTIEQDHMLRSRSPRGLFTFPLDNELLKDVVLAQS